MSCFDQALKTIIKPWFVIIYLCFTAISFFYFDKPTAFYFHHLALKTSFPPIFWLTKFGTGAVYMVFFLLAALFFRYIRHNKQWEARSWFLWLCVLVPNLICGILKVLIGRARPELLFDHQLYGFYGPHINELYWSFPSGHTTTVTALVLGLSILLPRFCYIFLIVGLTVISTRILLTNHYVSDVMLTGYLTTMEIGLLLFYLRQKHWLVSVTSKIK